MDSKLMCAICPNKFLTVLLICQFFINNLKRQAVRYFFQQFFCYKKLYPKLYVLCLVISSLPFFLWFNLGLYGDNGILPVRLAVGEG